jgi:hypothetical protein
VIGKAATTVAKSQLRSSSAAMLVISQLAGPIDDGVLAPWMGTGWHPDGGLHLPNTVLSVAFLISGRKSQA